VYSNWFVQRFSSKKYFSILGANCLYRPINKKNSCIDKPKKAFFYLRMLKKCQLDAFYASISFKYLGGKHFERVFHLLPVFLHF